MIDLIKNKKIRSKVEKIIKKVMFNEEIEFSPDINLYSDIGMDSLATAEMIMEIEEKFDIEIDEEDFEYLFTIEEIINYINDKF